MKRNIMKNLLFIWVFILLSSPVICFAEFFNGVLHFRDGQTIEFIQLGSTDDKKAEITVIGRIGSQHVSYHLIDLKSVIFSDPKALYMHTEQGKGSELIIVSKSGERFTLSDGWIQWKSTHSSAQGQFDYTYQDPITRKPKKTYVHIKRDGVSQITVGANTGDLKWNQTTKEYFPRSFLYDPFTGDKLEWKKRN